MGNKKKKICRVDIKDKTIDEYKIMVRDLEESLKELKEITKKKRKISKLEKEKCKLLKGNKRENK